MDIIYTFLFNYICTHCDIHTSRFVIIKCNVPVLMKAIFQSVEKILAEEGFVVKHSAADLADHTQRQHSRYVLHNLQYFLVLTILLLTESTKNFKPTPLIGFNNFLLFNLKITLAHTHT